MSAYCKLDWVSIVHHERSPGWHTAKGLCSLAIFFPSNTHTLAAAPSHLPFNKPAVKPHYQGSLSNNWLPSVHPFAFCMREGGFALSRRATADNKSEWQAHSQRPPHTKAAAWWIIDIGNLTPTHPTPLHTSQMPMTDQYQGPICNSLLADYLRGLCLQSGYQYQHPACVRTEIKQLFSAAFIPIGEVTPLPGAGWGQG